METPKEARKTETCTRKEAKVAWEEKEDIKVRKGLFRCSILVNFVMLRIVHYQMDYFCALIDVNTDIAFLIFRAVTD